MRPSILVKPAHRGYKMDQKSRLSFARIYTVEHNVKVFDFGQVHERYEARLQSHFRDVWQFDTQLIQTPDTEEDEDEEEEEDEDEDEEDDDEDDDEEEEEEETPH
jgi:hypothetical protein